MKPIASARADGFLRINTMDKRAAWKTCIILIASAFFSPARVRIDTGPRAGALLIAVCLLAFFPIGAKANCSFTGGTGTSAVTFTPPASIVVPSSTPVNTVLYTSPLVPPAIAPQITCTGTTTYGVVNSRPGGNPAVSVNIYPTGIAGVGYAITHNDLTSYLYPYTCCTLAAGSYDASISSSLQLIKTGPIANGAVLSTGLLGYWRFSNNQNVESFTLANSVTFINPSCTVNTTPVNVTLPTVSTTALGTAVGVTAGRTAFSISLACSSGSKLLIEIDPTTTSSGIPGVLTKTSGALTRVGVQLLDSSGTAVTLSTPVLVGSTPNGTLNIPYYAQYYRTTTGTITVGAIAASATFTLTYQ